MTTDAQSDLNTQTELSAKDRYESAIQGASHHPMATYTAERVLDRLMGIRPNSRSNDLTKQIHEASGRGDIEQIIKLSESLKTLQADEEHRLSKLADMKSEFSFEDLLSAFPEDLQRLAYELADDVLKGVQQAINGGGSTNKRGTRTPKAVKSYLIKKGDQQITAIPNTAKPSAPGKDREFFEFMGFTVSADGKSLEPSSFVNTKGENVTIVSKKAIIQDMLEGNDIWINDGYSIEEINDATGDGAGQQASGLSNDDQREDEQHDDAGAARVAEPA